MIEGNILLATIYISGCVVAAWICGNMVKKAISNGEEVESGMAGCMSCLSWIAVIILLTRYREHL
jgi:hypothetical protein